MPPASIYRIGQDTAGTNFCVVFWRGKREVENEESARLEDSNEAQVWFWLLHSKLALTLSVDREQEEDIA